MILGSIALNIQSYKFEEFVELKRIVFVIFRDLFNLFQYFLLWRRLILRRGEREVASTWSSDAKNTDGLEHLLSSQHAVHVSVEHQEYLLQVPDDFLGQIPFWILLEIILMDER